MAQKLNAVEMLEQAYVKNRSKLLCEDGTFRTPLVVLREVAKEFGTPIHLEFHEVHLTRTKLVYQVEMYTGRLKGRGEAPRRRLAIQIAAYDLLLKVEGLAGYEVPPYGLLPGSRINPMIFGELTELCRVLQLTSPFYVCLPNDPEEEVTELYSYKCQIGQLFRIGKSDSRFIAQRIAAKLVFEALTEYKISLDEVSMGPDCHVLENFKIEPGTSSKKLEILKFRMDSREEEKRAAAASLEYDEDEFGDNTETLSSGHGIQEAIDKIGQLNIHDIRNRVKMLSLIEEEGQEETEERDGFEFD